MRCGYHNEVVALFTECRDDVARKMVYSVAHIISFDSDSPSVEAFLSCYEDKTESLHTLALNLAHLMNPNVKEMTAGEKKQAAKQETGSLEEQKQSSESDTIEQLQKYKGLLDAGVITEEEFTAKKKQLLGI